MRNERSVTSVTCVILKETVSFERLPIAVSTTNVGVGAHSGGCFGRRLANGAHQRLVNRLHVLHQIMAHRVLDAADGAAVVHRLARLRPGTTLLQVDAVDL